MRAAATPRPGYGVAFLMTTLQNALNEASSFLQDSGEENPRAIAEMVLSFVTGLSRVELYLSLDESLNADQLARLQKNLERRAAGEPLQYVLGEASFRHLILKTGLGVLIPRPETEILVDVAMEMLGEVLSSVGAGNQCDDARSDACSDNSDECNDARSDKSSDSSGDKHASRTINIADIGTGTGAIALSLAQELPVFLEKSTSAKSTPTNPCTMPHLHLYASDISSRALELVKENARALEPEALAPRACVHFLESDLFAHYPAELCGHLDLIVSNPPYIPDSVLEQEVPAEVKEYEPWEALSGGADGLEIFRRLAKEARAWLKDGGALCVELFEDSLDDAADFLREENGNADGARWADISVTKDLTGRPRILSARLTKPSRAL